MKLKFLIPLLLFTTVVFGQKSLHLYGGENHDVYLGCLNCDDISQNSIWNSIGIYGSNISSTSIWNSIGIYGSDISSYSPFNAITSHPPIIVDKEGNFYGYLTANNIKNDRADFKLALAICKYYKEIQKDVAGWYKKNLQLIYPGESINSIRTGYKK